MFLWFLSLSVLIVLLVFQSPAIDHRLVALGALLPLAEIALGDPFVLHTLVASVALLAIVMLAGRGRRLVQRRWLGLPIGTFLHLVLDGTWTRTELFWWPFAGEDALLSGDVPDLDRPLWLILVQEVIGLIVLVWLARTYRLTEPGPRRRLITTGRLS